MVLMGVLKGNEWEQVQVHRVGNDIKTKTRDSKSKVPSLVTV